MDIIGELQRWFTNELPNVVQALLILLVGWIVALILSSVTRNLLQRGRVDERLSREVDSSSLSVTSLASRGIFWLVLLFAIVGALDQLNLGGVADPFRGFLDQILGFIPNLIAAGVLALVAWVVATLVRRLIEGALAATDWDERLRQSADMDRQIPLGESLGTLGYWLVWLLFLPGILDALGIEGLLAPVQAMINDVLTFLPNLFAAAVILGVGYLVARIVRDIVTNLLASTGIDRMAERFGFGGTERQIERTTVAPGESDVPAPAAPMSLSRLIGTVLFALVLIPVAITALDALNLEALSAPAISMLERVLAAIPNIFAAGVLLAIAYFAARLVADIVSNILSGVGFDRILSRIGLTNSTAVGREPSDIVGTLIIVGVMLFATAEAADLLGFESLAMLVSSFLIFFGNVILGLIVLGLGLYLANLAADALRGSDLQNAELLAMVARYAIILLAIFMAIQQMGIAEDIVTLAFTLILGAIAVAVAIAFGLGGRDIAARELQSAVDSLRVDQGVGLGDLPSVGAPSAPAPPAMPPMAGDAPADDPPTHGLGDIPSDEGVG